MNPNSIENSTTATFNLKEELDNYLIYWRWFVLSLVVCITVAFLYLRYAIPNYKAVATILVQDERKGSMASELSAFADLGLLNNVKNNVDNEIEVIKSRRLIESAIRDLSLQVSYFSIGRVKSPELYTNSPIEVVFSTTTPEFDSSSSHFDVQFTAINRFDLATGEGKSLGNYSIGVPISYKGSTFVVLPRKKKPIQPDTHLLVAVTPISNLVEHFKSRLTIAAIGKNTSVIELSLVDPVQEKAEDFLNALIENYNQDAISDKKYVAENTSRFIEQRLLIISDELKGVESDVESFKKQNKVTDIVSEAGLFLENATEFEKKELETETQLKVVSSILDYMNSNTSSELLPANVLPAEEGASASIAQYNQLVLERNKLLKTAGSKNSMVLNLEAKITTLKSSVSSSLLQLQNQLKIKKKDITRQKAVLGGKISQIPTQEKIFRDIDRKQNIKEALYLYLLQKREETQISLAVTAPNAKVIDTAIASKNPVSPKRQIIFLGSLLLGLLIPFSILYIRRLLDTKVKSRLDIEQATTMPIIGVVPKSDSNDVILSNTSRTSTAESLRIVRTNLEFLLNEVPEGLAKTIFITSTFPKEGKTFISVNLASTIALSDKKVLLLGLDIRNPKIDDYLSVPKVGVTNYLASNEGENLADFITKVAGFSNLFVMPAGVVPPNPAELLMGKKVPELFEQLKQDFDYIIVDTAPVSLVTDTLLISKYADAFVYVARANYLDKRMLSLPERLYQEKKLPNMSILINDTDSTKGYGYGYGYGYGVEVEKKSFWKRFFK
ncbi:GumC family protein [Flavobacterium sasangense]|uniref:GumC family protein n=1 Tax=Flavobacterium sasangense TaxID=503361 RepID=UPI000690B4A3|nr:tyrosine-protein kinase [Flavobacterium sasangense]